MAKLYGYKGIITRLLKTQREIDDFGAPKDLDFETEFDQETNKQLLIWLDTDWNGFSIVDGKLLYKDEVVTIQPPGQAWVDAEAKALQAIIANQQKIELLSLPNWATWTATQARDNVSALITNGMTIEQCNAAIDAANSIAKILPILKNIVRAIYAIEGILTAMARAIIYIRDVIKP